MLSRIVKSLTTKKQQRFLKKRVAAARTAWVKRFRRYDPVALDAVLREMGITSADTLLVHANFRGDSGFTGRPNDVVTVFRDLVGQTGTLLMVSQPFRGYAYDYLEKGRTFDVRKTVSMMGLVTEMFRRKEGTLRSLHPSHPVLAYGARAAELIEGHERCVYPCGLGTPFDKLRELDGKILFFDVGSGANTFFHHVEDLVKDRLDFPVYDDRLFSARVVDAKGQPRTVETYAYARGLKRRTDLLELELAHRGMLEKRSVGNSTLLLVAADDIARVMIEMIESGVRLIYPAAERGAS